MKEESCQVVACCYVSCLAAGKAGLNEVIVAAHVHESAKTLEAANEFVSKVVLPVLPQSFYSYSNLLHVCSFLLHKRLTGYSRITTWTMSKVKM